MKAIVTQIQFHKHRRKSMEYNEGVYCHQNIFTVIMQ